MAGGSLPLPLAAVPTAAFPAAAPGFTVAVAPGLAAAAGALPACVCVRARAHVCVGVGAERGSECACGRVRGCGDWGAIAGAEGPAHTQAGRCTHASDAPLTADAAAGLAAGLEVPLAPDLRAYAHVRGLSDRPGKCWAQWYAHPLPLFITTTTATTTASARTRAHTLAPTDACTHFSALPLAVFFIEPACEDTASMNCWNCLTSSDWGPCRMVASSEASLRAACGVKQRECVCV